MDNDPQDSETAADDSRTYTKPDPRNTEDAETVYKDESNLQSSSQPETNKQTFTEATERPTANTSNTTYASASIIVLQWLTYAFWGWVVLIMSFLIHSVLSFYISKDINSGYSSYGIAAALVLLPIAVVCDKFYSKYEPQKKTGPSAIIMVIHAVIFALLGIASVIAVAFTAVGIFTNGTFESDAKVNLLSFIIIAVLYGVTFVRTIFPQKIHNLVKIYSISMVSIVGIIIILTVAGPVLRQRSTINDRLIDSSVQEIVSRINVYTNKTGKLPNNLNELRSGYSTAYMADDTSIQQAITKNLIEYKPNTLPPTIDNADGTVTTTSSTDTASESNKPESGEDRTLYYQLCANYTAKSDSIYINNNSAGIDKSGYTFSADTQNHSAGHVCYDIRTTYRTQN